jgi:O-antigen ligase
VNRESFDRWCERGILGLVVVILAFGPLATGAVLPTQFLGIQGLAIGAATLWLARLWVNPGLHLYWPPACWGVIVFVAYAVGRYQWADIEYVARQELIRVVVYAVLFLVIVNNLRQTEYARIMTFALMLLAVALCFFAIYQYVSHYDKIWHFVKPRGYLNRGSGTYINPNHFGGLLEMVLPLGLAGALTSRSGHVVRIVLGYGAMVLLAGIGVSGSRGAWLATGLSLSILLAVVLFQSRFRLRAVLGLAVILSLTGYFIFRIGAPPLRLDQSFSDGRWTDARRDIWQTAWRMWQDHLWFGVGPGHFDYRFAEYRQPLVPLQMDPLYVHNDYLNALTDWGLAGALTIAATWLLLYSGVFKSWRAIRRSLPDARSNKLAVLLGAGCGLCAILIHSFSDFNLQVPANAIVMAALMGLLVVNWRYRNEDGGMMLRSTGRILAGLLIVLGVSYLGWQGWRKANESVWLQRADSAKRRQDLTEAQFALEKAFDIEPRNFETAYAIGEILRAQSFAGNADYKELAEQAMVWLERAMTLNPHDAYAPARVGMCLDWTGNTNAAGAYFERANKLDPNGYYMLALQGWHRVQLQEYSNARDWFERSLKLMWSRDNPVAASYLEVVNRALAQKAERQGKGAGP